MRDIKFYRSNEKPYGAFSNLYRCGIEFEGLLFPTAEHAYQYGKPRKSAVREWLMAAPSPSLLAMAAHGLYSWDISTGWSAGKVQRMLEVLRAKFNQHEGLRNLLLSTGDAVLIEVSKTDNPVNRFWGQVNGRGENMLGTLLMQVRDELQHAPATSVQPQGEGEG